MTRQRAVVDQHFGGQRAAIVVRRHRRSVRPGVADRDADRRPRAAAARGRGRRRRCSRRPGRRSRTLRGAGARRDRLDAVKGVVERRAHQLGHAGVDDRELAGRVPRLEIDRPAPPATPAGPTIERPGSMTIGRPVGRTSSTTSADTYSSRATPPAPVVGDAEAAAEIDVFERRCPAPRSSAASPATNAAARRSGSSARDLRADVDVHRRPAAATGGSAIDRQQLARGIEPARRTC